jgi:hypothetical protein
MNCEKHKLKCALVVFVVAGFVGFAFSGGFSEFGPVDKPACAAEEGHPAAGEGCDR